METVTKNGVTYTPASDNAALTYDSSGNVTGIASGTVEVTLENSTDPKITLDGSTPFSFTAESTDGTLRIVKDSHSFNYVSGKATYSADKINFPEGNVGVRLSNAIFSSILGTITVKIPSGGLDVPFNSSGATVFNLTDTLTATVSGGSASGSISLSGSITYNAENKQITLAKDAAVSVNNLKLTEYSTALNFGITANSDSTLAIDGLYFVFKDGASVNITGSTFGLSGDVTLSGGDLSFGLLYLLTGQVSEFTLSAGATLTTTLQGLPLSITAPNDSSASISMTDGVFSVTTYDTNGINLYFGNLSALPINIKGTVKLDVANSAITFTKDTVAKVTLPSGTVAQITANADATSKFSVASDGTITLTPNEGDGTLNFKLLKSKSSSKRLLAASSDDSDYETTLDADIEVVSGSISFNLSTFRLDIAAGTVTKLTMGDYIFTTSNSKNAGGTISFTDEGGITYTPDSDDGGLTITVEGTGDSQFENVVLEALSGSFTLNPDSTFSIAKDTELKLTFSDTYSISFKTTDEAGGTLALLENGITFTPGDDDGHLELTVTNGDTTRTASLEMTGTVTYTFGGNIELAEGTVVKNVFEDGNELTITANTDASGTITFNPEGGLTITPSSSDALNVVLTDGEIEIFNITSIKGSISYQDGTVTASDGSEIRFTNYFFDENEMIMSTTGGESSIKFGADGTSYIASENAQFVLDYQDGETLELNNGTFTDNYDNTATITAGSVFKTNDDEPIYILETAGTYTLNGNYIKTTADGVEVSLSGGDTVSFDASAAVDFDGYNFSGEGTVSISENALLLNKGASLNKTFEDGTQLTVTANADAQNAITYDSESGIKIVPVPADSLTINIKDDKSVEILNITSINGTLYYSDDDILTFADGTEIDLSVYGIGGKISSSGGTSTVKFETARSTYTANDGATFKWEISDSDEYFELQNGSVIDAYDSEFAIITAGTTFTSNVTEKDVSDVAISFDKYILETASTYTLNGNEITTTKDNVEVSLTGGDTVSFDANSGVSFNGNEFSGSGTVTITNGEVSFVMTEPGSISCGGKTFTLTEAAPDGVTVSLTDDGFKVSHVITAEEVKDFADLLTLSESDIGKTFTEVAEIKNDNSYTAEITSTGIDLIRGLSDKASVQANSLIDGENSKNGTPFNLMTDSAGTITFNDKSYKITDDNEVLFHGRFKENSFTINAITRLDEGGEVAGNFNGVSSINNSPINIDAGADNVSVANNGKNVSISGVASGSTVSMDNNNIFVQVKDSMSINDSNYGVKGDADGVLINDKNVTGLDTNASLTTGAAGNYTVNTTPLEVTENDIIVALNENQAYIASAESKINSNSTTKEILDAFGVAESDAVIIPATATEEQRATLGNEGGIAIVEDTATPVTITGGSGDDTFVTKGNNVKLNMGYGGTDKVMALGGNVTLQNYDPRGDSGLQLTKEDMESGVKFGDNTVELTNATVSMNDNFVNLYDVSGNKSQVGFATNDDKLVDASGATEGVSLLAGGENVTNAVTKATLQGGSGNDSIYGGEKSQIKPGAGNDFVEMSSLGGSTVNYTSGNDTISGLNFAGESVAADTIRATVTESSVSGDDVILTTEDGTITVADAKNKDIVIGKEIWQVGDNINFDGVATKYIAKGTDASLNADNLTSDAAISLDSIEGDIKYVDASGYEGATSITGNSDKDNVITASEGGSTLNGNGGNNSLKGGNGADEFISESGKNTIANFEFYTGANSETADKLNTGEQAISGVKVSGDDITLKYEDGSAKVEGANGQIMQLQNKHTNNTPILAQFADSLIAVNEDADFYWAGGKNAVVIVGSNMDSTAALAVDLSNADFNNAAQKSFNGDIKELDASGYEGAAELTGNSKHNIITASEGGSTINGNGGNNSLKGGNGADEFISESGKNTIASFEFYAGNNDATADMINLGAQAIKGVNVSGDDVILKYDGGLAKIEGAAGQTIQLQNEHTGETPIFAQFAKDSLSVNDTANFYWASGKNTTVSVADYSANYVEIDLNNADFNDASKLSFYGNIREVDASGSNKFTELTGNDKNNVLKAGNNSSVLWGGNGGNDTLIGGDGTDIFIYKKGNGNDVIENISSDDLINFENLTLDDIIKVECTDSSIKFNFSDGGSITAKTDSPESVKFKPDDVTSSYSYSYNRTTGGFDSHTQGNY